MAVSFTFIENSSSPWHTRQVYLARWTQWEKITGMTFFAVDVLSIATSPYSSGEGSGGSSRSPWEKAEGDNIERMIIYIERKPGITAPDLPLDFIICPSPVNIP
jgi:hypothetical protein